MPWPLSHKRSMSSVKPKKGLFLKTIRIFAISAIDIKTRAIGGSRDGSDFTEESGHHTLSPNSIKRTGKGIKLSFYTLTPGSCPSSGDKAALNDRLAVGLKK